MNFRNYVAVFLLAAGVSLVSLPIRAADFRVQFKPLTDATYDPVDLDSVHVEEAATFKEWMESVKAVNPHLAGDISAQVLGTLQVVRLRSSHDRFESIKPLVRAARAEAALWGANALYLEDTAVEEGTGRPVELTFLAYRVQYKEWVVCPAYLAALPYNPLPDYFVAQKLQQWNSDHFGRVKISFAAEQMRARHQKVVELMGRIKDGTPVRLVLRNGSDIKGSFSGLDQDDLIWVRPAGLSGFLSHRSIRSEDVETVGILN